ncbi:hypothetical protein CH063_01854 [Colletotrichum higginsianum]|uniref:Uncharacterized protein n=1 Tax=Colletotrichum higginsianum (strain IMI 349063) TaxID=759273 RepID=H1VD69_COLHI|nr:hypothetical protein CH063_01854 [Colletotrichum higginsianum]
MLRLPRHGRIAHRVYICYSLPAPTLSTIIILPPRQRFVYCRPPTNRPAPRPDPHLFLWPPSFEYKRAVVVHRQSIVCTAHKLSHPPLRPASAKDVKEPSTHSSLQTLGNFGACLVTDRHTDRQTDRHTLLLVTLPFFLSFGLTRPFNRIVTRLLSLSTDSRCDGRGPPSQVPSRLCPAAPFHYSQATVRSWPCRKTQAYPRRRAN